MLAGRCRCGAGKFLSSGCAGARENELPVPRAGNRQCQVPLGTALGGTGTRQKGCPRTAGFMSWHHQGGFVLNPAIFVVPVPWDQSTLSYGFFGEWVGRAPRVALHSQG